MRFYGNSSRIMHLYIKLCSADPWTRTDLGPKTGPDRTGPDRTWASGTGRISKDRSIISWYYHIIISSYDSYDHIISSYHIIIISSYHHIIITSYHHIILSSYHHIIISSYHHLIVSSYHHSIIWQDQKYTCHFLVNSADRPGIWSNCNQIRLNPETIGRICQKMACEIFKLWMTQKSRGWLRFQRFVDEIDRIAPNFFFENCAPPEKIFVEPIRTEISARPIRDRRPDRTGPHFGTDPTDRMNIDY